MDEGFKIEGRQITLKTNIKVLKIQFDSALKWKAHLYKVEAKATRILNAFESITDSI
jgi:hypothetical protein